MLTSHSELFMSPDKIILELNSRTLAGAKECNIITTCKEEFIYEYGENEAFDATTGAYRHFIELTSLDISCTDDLSTLCDATVKIRLPKKEIVFSSCKVYKAKTKIVGGKECVSEICLLSPHKTVREV